MTEVLYRMPGVHEFWPMLRFHFLLVALLPVLGAEAQSPWSDATANRSSLTGERRIAPTVHRTVSIDPQAMRAVLDQAPTGMLQEVAGSPVVIDLPRPDGGALSFRFLEVPVLHPDLQAQYPSIRTFTGVGVEDPSVHVKFDLTPHGFHAMVLGDAGEDWFIDPLVQGNAVQHQVYFKKDFTKQVPGGFSFCSYEQENDIAAAQKLTRQWMAQRAAERVGDCQLRTYRLALACTGEYANYHGSNTGNNDKSFALAAMATTMNRVNGIYERDATLTMVIVPNNDLLVYLDGATDPYTNGSGSTMLGENQSTCNAVIGSANYDIGHVFSTGGGGIASLNSPCTSNKARGVTGQSNPIGDPFDIDYVAHEMGHQYGGNHTQNNNCNRAASAAVEVGSGITIMGYAGICAPDVASNSIAMFGGYSMQEMAANITIGNSSTCPVTTPLTNQPPTANAGPDRTIPSSTPFILTGTASDPNGTASLTYSWEQMDNAVATQPPQPTNTDGPAWEPLLPQNTPVRYMPNLPAVITNTTPTWEVLSSVTRDYTFRLTVRDNASGAGCNDQDNMIVNVDGNSGPFLVTQPNTSLSWSALSNQTVTWDVAGTTGAPVNCTAVDILLSLDGGLTYPITLATATPNDGSQTVQVPNQQTTAARVMVRANGNIFYDISNTDFTIAAPTSPDYTLAVTNATGTACQPGPAAYTVQVGSILGYSDPVTLGTSGLPAGLSASFGTNPLSPVGSTTLTIGNTNAVAPGVYNFTLTANSTSGPKSLALVLEVFASPGQVSLLSPTDGTVAFSPGSPLTWNADPNADTYDIQIATDPGMTNIVESGSGITGTSYQTTVANQPLTTYYWRVQSVNTCGFGTPSPIWSYTTDACVNVTVRIVLDRYGSETTWSIEDGGGAVYASGGPYTDAASNGEYPQPDVNVCLPAGCYDLIVNDSFGDGMCCAYGNGFIGVLDGASIPLARTDAFQFTSTVPFCVPAACGTPLPYSEDFEGGSGDWLQGFEDDIDWTLLSGGTPSGNTGPSGDHTSGGGNYLYVEATNPNFPSKLAELYGPCIDLSGIGSAQLSFWYHMWGADMGTLSLDVFSGGSWTTDVWTLSGDQGNSWQQAVVSLTPYAGGPLRLRFRGTTGANFTSDMAIDDINVTGTSEVQVQVKAWLEGPYDDGSGSMTDELRAGGLLPLSEPYSGLGYAHVGGGGESTTAQVLAVTGANAIVDWVVVELRDANTPANVLATRSGLLQRDGDVVGMDGSSPLTFGVAPGSYHVALRHRNHLGCMSGNAAALDASPTVVDFRLAATATFGTDARKPVGSTRVLWAGNVVFDAQLKYTGSLNDRDPILTVIGGTVPTGSAAGYLSEDVNMDGQARYTGVENDRDIILQNIGGVVPTATRMEQLP